MAMIPARSSGERANLNRRRIQMPDTQLAAADFAAVASKTYDAIIIGAGIA